MKLRISLNARFILVGAAYAFPIVILLHFMITEKSKSIEFAEMEIKGNIYLRNVVHVFDALARHHLLTIAHRNANAGTISSGLISQTETTLDRRLDELAKVQGILGEDLQFTSEGLAKRGRKNFTVVNLQSGWAELKTSWRSLSPDENRARHLALISIVKGMISHAGDTSNLILDPDLDSYYLMDAILLGLPLLQARIHESLYQSIEYASKQSQTTEDMIGIRVLQAQISADLERVATSIRTSINEDENFHTRNNSLQNEMPAGLKALLDRASRFTASLDSAVSRPWSQQLMDEGLAAFDESFRIWDIGASILDSLLQARIDEFEGSKRRSLVLVALSWFLAIFLARQLQNSVIQTTFPILNRLRRISLETKQTSTMLHASADKTSTAAVDQAAAMQETVATINQIQATINRSVEIANASAQRADASFQISEESRTAFNTMRSAMDGIRISIASMFKQLSESNQKMSETISIIDKISEKTNIINNIVFQTKLLAFNASVEAARAGESGKGFAVVAEEVGNLAQMSGMAAQEINSLLKTSRSAVTVIVQESKQQYDALEHDETEKIESGIRLADRCNETLIEVLEHVGCVKNLMSDILEGARETALAINNIVEAMHVTDMATHINASVAQETKRFAEALHRQAKLIDGLVLKLTIAFLGSQSKESTVQHASIKTPPRMEESPSNRDAIDEDGDEQSGGIRRVSGL
ncbi:MAG TPA: methyl-accepting chemotaxis protein [Oligoflexus sp.]|uniref:methyl-accepting chemotaxis protein n=1 Tax=Oligoflexus sp. TaxID=1971216 RepID=UPI002D2726FC|nr:methyl-accepting chemotaxis protein [Oligoflexus sp.]HYX33727.1 methyl-accepting chemotaxis protein [Oligoflexus sp.]